MRPRVHWRQVLGLVLLGVLLGAAACGGSDKSGDLTPTQEGSTPEPDVVETPGPAPTLDPNIALVSYDSPDKGYSIDYPEGWQVQAGGADAPDVFAWMKGAETMAQLSVGCTKGQGLTPDDLIQENNRLLGPNGIVNPASASPIEIAGVAGKRLRYHSQVGPFGADHAVAYFVTGDCGWRIGLSVPTYIGLDQFLPLFDRVLASFHYGG